MSSDMDKSDLNIPVQVATNEYDLGSKLDIILSLQRRQGKSFLKRFKRIEANLDLVGAQGKEYGREISIIQDKLIDRDKKLSGIQKRVDLKEDTGSNRELQLWKFVGSSESLFAELKQSMEGVLIALDELKVSSVTTDYCDKARATCNKKKKEWYEFIPIIVSAITLLVLISGTFVWLVKGPIAIDPATATEIKALINNNKLKTVLK